MKRIALLALLLASPALATDGMRDRSGNVFDIFGFGTQHWSAVDATARVSPEIGNDTEAVMITCTVACQIAHAVSPAVVFSSSFALPANTLLRLKWRGSNDGITLKALSTAGQAFIVELQ